MSERSNLEAQKQRLTSKLARTPNGSQSAATATVHLKQVTEALAKLPPEPAPAPTLPVSAPVPEPPKPQAS